MARYLSAAWFGRLGDGAPAAVPAGPDSLVLRQVVTGGPDGDVTYDVIVAGGTARIEMPATATPDLTFTSDYPTAAGIASGEFSTQAALAAGRLRVGGDVAILSTRAGEVAGLDPVPADLRADTEF
jgi:hypothetical protein